VIFGTNYLGISFGSTLPSSTQIISSKYHRRGASRGTKNEATFIERIGEEK
jgi:hypothetical protein